MRRSGGPHDEEGSLGELVCHAEGLPFERCPCRSDPGPAGRMRGKDASRLDRLDIYVVCHAGLMEPADCWSLWRQRQQKAGSDIDPHRARLAVETHLTRLSQHRPLEAIADPDQRAEAEAVRSWLTQELLHAHLD